MIAWLVMVGLALVGAAAVVAVVAAIIGRRRARVGRVDPGAMTEILSAERSAHVSHGPRGAQGR